MSVASKNLYDLLGNDIEDPDAAPKVPTKIVEKATTHTTKRNADGVAPAKAAGVNARGGVVGNDAGFRDRQSGNASNNTRSRNDVDQPTRGGRGARVRGGRGARRPPTGDERHSRSIPSGGSDKQAALSWGATEGQAELKDEIVGEQIAQAEQKEAVTEDATAEEAPVEEEDKTISYADYLVQQAEKKLALEQENALKVRKANEGSKADKKWANAKELVKSEEDEVLFAGAGGKAKRERERKQKQFVELENRFIEAPREGGERRGGRGGARGEFSGRGRGEGGRGRGEGRGRGGPRGGARGDFRGGRGGAPRAGGAAPVNPNDQSAFPSLGS